MSGSAKMRERRSAKSGARDSNAISTSNSTRRPTRRTRRKRSGTLSLGVWSSRALLMVVAAMYSTNFASVKYLETFCLEPPCEHDPSEAAFCRFLLSSFVCLPILYSNRKSIEIIKAGMECGFWMTVNYICQAEALEYISAGKCGFIGALGVVTVPLYAGFFLGRPIKLMSFVSALVAMVGVAILENLLPIGIAGASPPSAPAGGGSFFGGIGKGDILALGQPIGFGYAVMRIDQYIEKYSHVPNHVLTLTAAQCVSVCVLSFIWILYDCGGMPDLSYMLETHRIVALGWTGMVTSVLAIVLQGIALQKASATDASLIFSSEPVFGSLFAGWLLNEKLTKSTYIGGAFILAACVLGSLTTGGDEKTTSTENRRKRFKSKSSDVSDDSSFDTSLLPTVSNHKPGEELSIESMHDVQKFPTSVGGHDLHHRKAGAFV